MPPGRLFHPERGLGPAARGGQEREQWHPQFHLRFAPVSMTARRTLGVVLCPGHACLQPAVVSTERDGEVEVAIINEDRVWLNPTGTLDGAVALFDVSGVRYAIRDDGIAVK